MKNVEKPLVFLGFLRSGQPQLASKIGLEAVLSQLEANLSQLEANLRQLEANLSQLEASWSQHEANLSQLEANLSQLGPTCGCQAGGCQAGGCQTGGCQAGGCQSSGCQRPRPSQPQPTPDHTRSCQLCICQEIRSPLSIYVYVYVYVRFLMVPQRQLGRITGTCLEATPQIQNGSNTSRSKRLKSTIKKLTMYKI